MITPEGIDEIKVIIYSYLVAHAIYLSLSGRDSRLTTPLN